MEGDKKREPDLNSSNKRKKQRTDSSQGSAEPKESLEQLECKETMANGSVSRGFVNGNTVANQDMCIFCFDVLVAHHFKKVDKPCPSFTNDSYPLFVTWKIGNDKRLRGCIGTFTSMSLHKGIKEYALNSAMSDSRFSPISKHELSQLTVSVSLLVGFENGKNYLDWTVGVHGIKIEFNFGRSTKTATFLPDVAKEQGWTKEDTVESLLKKAGVRGPISQSMKDGIKLIRYRSEKVEMDFNEYVEQKGHIPELMNGCYVPLSNGHSSNGYGH